MSFKYCLRKSVCDDIYSSADYSGKMKQSKSQNFGFVFLILIFGFALLAQRYYYKYKFQKDLAARAQNPPTELPTVSPMKVG